MCICVLAILDANDFQKSKKTEEIKAEIANENYRIENGKTKEAAKKKKKKTKPKNWPIYS